MACGVPLVSTTGGALPEVVGDAGLLVPPADAGALAAAIESLMVDRERRAELGRAGRARIEQHFDWLRVAQQMTEFYAKVMQR